MPNRRRALRANDTQLNGAISSDLQQDMRAGAPATGVAVEYDFQLKISTDLSAAAIRFAHDWYGKAAMNFP